MGFIIVTAFIIWYFFFFFLHIMQGSIISVKSLFHGIYSAILYRNLLCFYLTVFYYGKCHNYQPPFGWLFWDQNIINSKSHHFHSIQYSMKEIRMIPFYYIFLDFWCENYFFFTCYKVKILFISPWKGHILYLSVESLSIKLN